MTKEHANQDKVFNLTAKEQQLSNQLSQIIKQEIKNSKGGVIPFERYMELALYYPGLGYYCNGLYKFGAKGDFITAPTTSWIFGHLLAEQAAELINFGTNAMILEFGAGNGRLAADILLALGESLHKYYIVELSSDLIAWQKETISQHVPQYLAKVEWLNSLPEEFNGIILANEVLDAQPVSIIRCNNEQIIGLGVSNNTENQFYFTEYSLNPVQLQLAQSLPLPGANYQTEIHTLSRIFISSLAKILKHGALILIDYGYGEREYYMPHKNKGTIRSFYQHLLIENVLLNPGLMDITASVEWSGIATAGIDNGLELIGYTTQANFLINCGLTSLLDQLHAKLSYAKYLELSNQANKLISLNEMGEIFKVMGFSKGLTQDSWLGFTKGDRSYLL